jgi:hypothetical protein
LPGASRAIVTTHRGIFNSIYLEVGAAAGGRGIVPLVDALIDEVLALAASFACFLQRYTLEVEMLKSFATSLACLPLLSSFITASQSTLLAAKADGALAANSSVAPSIAEAAAIANFFIFHSPDSVNRTFSERTEYFKFTVRPKEGSVT